MSAGTTPNFEEMGLRFVALDAAQFEAILLRLDNIINKLDQDLKKVASSEDKTAKSGGTAGKSIDNLNKSTDRISPKVRQLSNIFSQFANRMAAASPFGYSLSSALQLLGSTSIGTTIAIGSLVAGFAAFLALGHRGAAIEGVTIAFGKLSEQVGMTAAQFKGEMREAARGTVSDYELMKQANLALAGATGKYRDEFAKDLPKILELARTQAIATGQSVEYLFNSLVLGVKRASPRLIDNTGIVLKMSETYEEFAAKLGKSADSLSDEEKQLAVLDAMMTAHDETLAIYGGSLETAATQEQQLTTMLQNFIDELGMKAQPAYKEFLAGLSGGLESLIKNFDNIAAVLKPFIDGIAAALTGIVKFLSGIAEAIASSGFVQTLVTTLGGVVQILGDLVNAIAEAIGPTVNWIFGAVGRVLDFALKAIVIFADSLGKAVGAIANGLIWAYNHIIAPVILWIATGIADFLMGSSPPPKGPLSKIDEGGRRTMEAWVEGFSGANLQPVEEVAAAVMDAMGPIARLTLPQVEERLKALDTAIQPFKDQLDIIKARFEEIAKPAEEAFKAIDRQIGKAMEALARGDTTAADTIRTLDAQREAIQGYVDVQQESLDMANIQLSLAQAMQGEERSLLEIRKGMLPVEKAIAAKKDEAAKKAGAGAAKPAASGGIGPIKTQKPPEPSWGLKMDEGADQGAAGQPSALASFLGIDQTGAAEAKANSENIGKQFERINKALSGEAGASIKKGFEDTFKSIIDALKKMFEDFFNWLLDPKQDGGFVNFFVVKIPAAIAGVGDAIKKAWNDNVRQPLLNSGVGPTIASIEAFFSDMPQKIAEFLAPLTNFLNLTIIQPFLLVIDSVTSAIESFINDKVIPTMQGLVSTFRVFFQWLLGQEAVDKFVYGFPRISLGRVSEQGQRQADINALIQGINDFVKSGQKGYTTMAADYAKSQGIDPSLVQQTGANKVIVRDLSMSPQAQTAPVVPGVTTQPSGANVPTPTQVGGALGGAISNINNAVQNFFGVQDQGDAARRAAGMNAMVP